MDPGLKELTGKVDLNHRLRDFLFLGVLWLRFTFQWKGVGSIPGWRATVPHAWQPKNQSKKQKQYCNKFNKDLKKVVYIKKKK